VDLLRHLDFFVAVADARHFGEAARGLGMTQPPLSQGVRKLERRLGVRLFERDARGVRITDAGNALLPAARELLRLSGDLIHQARELVLPDQVRVGLAGDLEGLVDPVVQALAHTRTGVVPTVAGSVELVDLLREGLLDLAVVRHPGVVDGLIAGEVLVVPTRVESYDGPVALAGCRQPVAVPPRHHQPPAHDQVVDALRRAGHSGEVLEAADVAQRAALRAAGVAVRLIPTLGPVAGDAPPLRLRVVRPHDAQRRPEVDHSAVAAVLEHTLAP
jgi:DNA-binding transcriptional LysR family regulator